MTETTTVRASALRRGTTIICPGDGQPERVTFARKGGAGRRFVRTTRHDHFLPNARTVEVAR